MTSRLDVDLLVVGGGIHGAAVARDAAGRGLRVLLVEQGDLAGATSSASSKLAHGGLRYLELGDFRLVREALRERQTLMRAAAHLVRPAQFFLPAAASMRPVWQLRAGLALYDWLGGSRGLPRSRALDLSDSPDGRLLQPQYRRGFCYYDGLADDARLVLANALDAAARGALVMTRTRCVRATPMQNRWSVELLLATGARLEPTARAIVNATGPWVGQFLAQGTPIRTPLRVRLIKGSHLVVRRAIPGERALLLQNDDRRVVFVIPFEGEFALVGTTDVPLPEDMPLSGNPGAASISAEEVEYLRRAVNRYFAQALTERDIVWTFSGVRALRDDGRRDPSRVRRDYALRLDHAPNGAPILSICGGKLTTHRRLAEKALLKLAATFRSLPAAWTAGVMLPGGDLGGVDPMRYAECLRARYPGLPAEVVNGIARRHGALAETVLGAARRPEDLGVDFGGGLTAREVEYFFRREWAHDPDDVLWLRTKAGLHLSEVQSRALAQYCRDIQLERPEEPGKAA
jgi:glycerol-3-phosphate dehydrogenase